MQIMSPEDFKAMYVFEPDGAKQRDAVLKGEVDLVHYTTAAVAGEIFKHNEVWMRNVSVMNDYSEVQHGVDLLFRFFKPVDEQNPDVGRVAFFKAFDDIFPGMLQGVLNNFSGWLEDLMRDSYIVCLSEHDKKDGDNGRLSMWRAYGKGQVAVAIMINPLPLYAVTNAMGAFSSPVSYFTREQFFDYMNLIAANVTAQTEFVKSLGEEAVSGHVFSLLLKMSMCCKHPGFDEEREWRIIHVPKMWPDPKLKRATHVVAGIPQSVYKITLEDHADGELVGIEIKTLVKRVIIGPTDFPYTVYEALVHDLKSKGIEDAGSKVVASQIPLRVGPW